MKIKSIEDIKKVVMERYSELEDIKVSYLNDAGLAAKEAYQALIWHLSFHNNIDSLKEDNTLTELVNISGKHPEYYMIISSVSRAVDRIS